MARIRFVGFIVLLGACAPVPELSFGDDDSAVTAEDAAVSADASVPPPVIVSDSATPPVDAPSNASDASDAAASLVCPSTPPPAGITKCCGTTGCVDLGPNGAKCADCADCNQQKCPAGNICCYRPGGNFNCRKNLADCK